MSRAFGVGVFAHARACVNLDQREKSSVLARLRQSGDTPHGFWPRLGFVCVCLWGQWFL